MPTYFVGSYSEMWNASSVYFSTEYRIHKLNMPCSSLPVPFLITVWDNSSRH